MLSGYAQKIADIPPFQNLSTPLRERLAEIVASIGDPHVLAEGDTLYEKGAEDLNTGAVLIEGDLNVDPGEGETITISAPNVIGEMQQFDEYGQRTATVKAAGYATVMEFSWHEFVERIKDTPQITEQDRLEIQHAFQELVGDRFAQFGAKSD